MTTPYPSGSDKSDWRLWARATRDTLSSSAAGEAVLAGLRADPGYRSAGHILLYLPFGSEIDPTALLRDDKHFYLTRTWSDSPSLTLHPYRHDSLERHRFGYRQPTAQAEIAPADAIDVALVPGLAFDQSGRRLGYGGGYFDRLLPGLRSDALRIGVTLEGLVVPALPAGTHDVAMTHLATERGVRSVEAAGDR